MGITPIYTEVFKATDTDLAIIIFIKKNLEPRCMLATRNHILISNQLGCYLGGKLAQIEGKHAKYNPHVMAAIDVKLQDVRPIATNHVVYVKPLGINPLGLGPNAFATVLEQFRTFELAFNNYLHQKDLNSLDILDSASEIEGIMGLFDKEQIDTMYQASFIQA